MSTTKQQYRAELISGIRVLADFLERHPTLPVPHGLDVMAFPEPDASYATRCAEIDRIADAHNAELRDQDGHHTAHVSFGRVSYHLVAISDEARARHDALMSYLDSVALETATHADEQVNKPLDIPTADVYGRQCPCGALTDKGARLCRKCRSRGRWNRRKAPYRDEEEQW
ncbi:hypothetical protein [Planobispora rosea]|uniref:hypothetical protein n=1 Tax=Planobispora rosea TaxID=35762 RepID=UPI000839F9DD|nr:hypothetical protein [Planobispora rosea]